MYSVRLRDQGLEFRGLGVFRSYAGAAVKERKLSYHNMGTYIYIYRV